LVKFIARLIGSLLLACNVAAASQPVPSTPYVWRNVTVGAGGYAPGIVFSTAEKGLAYLRTDMGGAYRWEAREQRWIPLQEALAEGSYMGVESIAADPLNPDVVYLAAGMYFRDPSAVLRSEDRGRSWAIYPVSFAMGGNEDGRGLGERLAIDPHRTSTLFFGSRHDGLQAFPSCCSTQRTRVPSMPRWPTPRSTISTAHAMGARHG
jgi:xyloglucan-specific exo-beta-1,4-glucanase